MRASAHPAEMIKNHNGIGLAASATMVAMGARISDRIAAIAESATLAVDAKAKALKAAGRPVIGFGAGEPDFPTPDYIVEDAVEAGQVLITNGGKQAVYNAFAALLDPGDEVLLIAPYWTTYPESIKLAGGVPVEVVTDEASGYLATVEQLDAACTDRTKALLFVSPSNPTGAVYPPHAVATIGRWAAERGLWVITDEIYEHLVYGGAGSAHGGSAEASPAVSIATAAPELGDRVIVVNGVAKTYAMTGWRVGWLIGPPDVVKPATNLQSHATSNVN